MAGKSENFRLELASLASGLSMAEVKATDAMRMYVTTAGEKLVSRAKENAPWTDRTGHARQRLNSYSETIPEGIKLYLAHGVDYGVWLELAHEKNYAVVEPTIRLLSPEIMEGFANLINGLGLGGNG